MRLRNEFLSHRNGEESFIVPTEGAGFSGVVRGNKTFGDVVDLLKSETTELEIIDSLAAKYDAPRDRIEQDVKKALDILREIDALSE